eukprot:5731921-Lingulodinium_polyedra.AAC.1
MATGSAFWVGSAGRNGSQGPRVRCFWFAFFAGRQISAKGHRLAICVGKCWATERWPSKVCRVFARAFPGRAQ